MILVLAGLDNAGKTTLARLLVEQVLTEHAPTVRTRRDKLLWRKTKLIMVDSSGDVEIGRAWVDMPCDAFLFLVDGTDRSRFGEVRQELKKLYPRKLPIAILLNKSDLVTFCPVPELIRYLGVEEDDPESLPPMQAFECSLARGMGFQDALDWLVGFCGQRTN